MGGDPEATQRHGEQQPMDAARVLERRVARIGRVVVHIDPAALRIARRDLRGIGRIRGKDDPELDLPADIVDVVDAIAIFDGRNVVGLGAGPLSRFWIRSEPLLSTLPRTMGQSAALREER